MSAWRKTALEERNSSGAGPLTMKVLFGVVLIILSAKARVDLGPVPLTMQTLIVIWLAGIMKTGSGLLTLFIYWGAATFGLPVLASAEGQLWATLGVTGGYLAGFFPAWLLVARYCESATKPLAYFPVLGKALLAHAIILLCGGLWLGFATDWEIAWNKGLMPFLLPALIKSVLAAGLILVFRRALYGERPLSHGSW